MSFGVVSFVRRVVPAAAGAALLTVLCASSVSAAESTSSGSSSGSESSVVPERHFNVPDMPVRMDDLFNRRRPGPARVMPPPPQQAPRQRSILDDPGNWGFARPEDVVQEYMSRHIPKLPDYTSDGRDRNTMSPVERYYERQMRGGTIATNGSSSLGLNLGFGGAFGGFSPGMGAMDGLRPDNSGFESPTRPDALSDLLGLRNNPYSPQAIRERDAAQQQNEAFRKALEIRPPAGAGISGLVPAGSGSLFSGSAASSSSFTPALPKNPYDAVAGTYNQALAVAAPTAPVAPSAPTAPGQSRDSLTQSTASRVAPPKPDFSIPQRRF